VKCSDSPFSKCLYFSSNALARKTEKLAQESWKPVGLSPSLAYLLMQTIRTPGIQPGTLAEHLMLQPSTITRLIEKMETKKLLVRVQQGKQTYVYPTPKGQEMMPAMEACLANFYKKYVKILGKDESEKLIDTMNLMQDKL